MNDSFRTNVFVRFHPETIAAACIYLAARMCKVPLPNHGVPWWTLISHTTLREIRVICGEILRLYQRAKPDADRLEQTVSLLKKAQQEAKLKLKSGLVVGGGGGNTTPNQANSSRPATPSKISPYSAALAVEDQKNKADTVINGFKRKLKERNRSPSRSPSRSPRNSRKRGRPLPKNYRDRSRSNGRHRDHKPSKSKSKKRSRSPRSRSRSYERSGKKYRSRSRSRNRHRNSGRRVSRSRSRDRYSRR